MTYELCEKVRNLEPYEPVSGTYEIRLDANESYYPLPDVILDEIKQAVGEIDFNRYPDPCASELTEKFAEFYGLDPACVTVGNGSDELISVITANLLPKNSRVIVTEPDFSMYRFYASLCENEVISVPKDKDLNIDIDRLIKTANEENAGMIIFSNPCNPTGQGVPRAEARRLINSVPSLVVLDEAYMDFWDEALVNEADRYANLIVLRTASKCIGCAAIRLGFAVASPALTRALRSVKSPYNVNTVSQRAGVCVFSHGELLRERRAAMVESRNNLYAAVLKLFAKYTVPARVFETHTNFVYIESKLAQEIFDFMLGKGIAVRFFRNGALRITAGSEDENREVLDCMESFLRLNKINE